MLSAKKIQLYIKRDDLIHPLLSGNKWRKLKYNLLSAKEQQYKTLLTFGGAYSNHIHAVSAAGNLLGFKTIGIIRGEASRGLSPTLTFAQAQGMQLHFVDRQSYRKKQDATFIQDLKKQFTEFYHIPEGGSNDLALKGVAELVKELDAQLPGQRLTVCTACGTGGTLAGLISADAKQQYRFLGFPVLKNANWMYEDVTKLLNNKIDSNWSLMLDYHFGGYAKYNGQLLEFIHQFKTEFSIQLEQVYTAKMLFGIFDLIKQDYFSPGTTIVAIHTGGLQGLVDFNNENI